MTEDSGTVEGVRQRNLARLIRLVHLSGPLSRAALTAATGLNRSTVGDLVTELVAQGWVEERAPAGPLRVGRPSPVVHVASDVVVISAHPEVDALELAAVGMDQRIVVRTRLPQDRLLSPEETARLIGHEVRQWQDGELAGIRVLGVGLAVPGPVRESDGVVRHAPHLQWRDAPLRELVTRVTGIPVVVGNDATLGVLAEHLFGAARGIDDVVYLNGGASGIGGGLIVHGTPVGGVGGYAGEFGQNRPGIAAARDRRTPDGVLEDDVNRNLLLAAVGLDAGDDAALARALADAPDVSEVERQRRILATALANAVNVLNPAVIVLGGFLALLAEWDAEGFEAAVTAQSMPACAEGLSIRAAELAEDRLLIGAAEAVYARLFGTERG